MRQSPSIFEEMTINGPDGGTITFELDEFRSYCMLNGLDDIGLTHGKGVEDRQFRSGQCRKASLGLKPVFVI